MKLSLVYRISVISILIVIPVFQALAQTQRRSPQSPDNRPRTASISGRVTVSGKPAVNARVGLAEIKERNNYGNQDFSIELRGMNAGEDYSALTDADGRYRLTGLPDGNFEVRVKMKAYVAEKKSGGNDLVRAVSLDVGEAANDVDFSLVRGGVITGVVTDAGGQPMISGRVQLQIIDDQGKKQAYQRPVFSQMFETDDRGVYRIYGLRAGRYLVSAGGEGGFQFLESTGGKYPRTWHLDTDDEKQAKIIEVTEGGEATGVDIRFGLAKRTYEASGRVVDDATGKPMPKISLLCMQTKVDGPGLGGWSGQATTDAQGNFRFNGLAPGKYVVEMMNLMAFLPGGGESNHYAERTTFEVKAGDLDYIEIRAKLGGAVSGVAVIEGSDDPSVKASLSQSVITFNSRHERSDDPDSASAFGFSTGGMPSMIKADGSFRITGVRPGKVTFDVANLTGKSMTVIRVERNGADVSGGMEVRGGETVTGVRVVVGHGTAVIRGQVNIVGGALPEGWRMNVFSSKENSVGRIGGFAPVDGKGRFAIEGLLPGEYSLTLTAAPPPDAGTEQGVGRPAPVRQKVTVASGAQVQVTLTLELNNKSQEER